jgi:Skp family chaperone for outer membrane proteins
MSKFKNIAESAPSRMEKKLDELEALRVEAKNLRERFEKSGGAEEELSEEKRRQLEEEFKFLKGGLSLRGFHNLLNHQVVEFFNYQICLDLKFIFRYHINTTI